MRSDCHTPDAHGEIFGNNFSPALSGTESLRNKPDRGWTPPVLRRRPLTAAGMETNLLGPAAAAIPHSVHIAVRIEGYL